MEILQCVARGSLKITVATSCVCLLPHSFISFDCCSFSSNCVFISLCVASVALALVFMPGLYSAAYKAVSLA